MRRIVLALVMVLLFNGASAYADAPRPIERDAAGATLAPFEPSDEEQVYIAKSLRAIQILGWGRGDQQDSWWDWQMGERYTFEPWAIGYPRDVWAQTPGQRFAFWWTQYCFMNCANPPTPEQVAALAEDFDAALEKIGR